MMDSHMTRFPQSRSLIAGAFSMVAPITLAAPASAQAAGVTVSTSNNQLFAIISHADPVVKFVMAILVVASIATWAIWFVKHKQLRAGCCQSNANRSPHDALSSLGTAA